MFKLVNKNITDQEIAEIFAKNIMEKKDNAIDVLIERYLTDIPSSKDNINYINGYNLCNPFVFTPKGYAKFCISLATYFIVDYYRIFNSFISYSVKKDENYIEFSFDIYKSNSSDNSVNILIYMTKNGVIVDINNDYVSIVKERDKNGFTGKWNANISKNLIDKLSGLYNHRNIAKKAKRFKFDKK